MSEGFIEDYYLPAESKADKTTPLSSFSTDYRDWHQEGIRNSTLDDIEVRFSPTIIMD